jgi:hypothetical protein
MRGLIQGLLPALLIFCVGCSKEEAGVVSAASEAYRVIGSRSLERLLRGSGRSLRLLMSNG